MARAADTIIQRSRLDTVPSNWQVAPLGSVASTQYGITATASENGTLLMLGMKDLVDGQVSLSDVVRIESDEKVVEEYRLYDGDILFNRTNSADLVGKTAIFRDAQPEPYVFASYLVRVTVNREQVNSKFICYFMNWSCFRYALYGFIPAAQTHSD